MSEPISPTRNQQDIRLANMKLMKQQILDIRERCESIPTVPEASIVSSFEQLYEIKSYEILSKIMKKRIVQKQKEYKKISLQLDRYKQKYIEKQKSFKDKQLIPKVLNEKLQKQYEKTKAIFRDVSFTRSITSGVKKLNYYRIAEALLNQNSREIFCCIQELASSYSLPSPRKAVQTSIVGTNGGPLAHLVGRDQEVGICMGYLGLLVNIVGELAGARMWMDFVFKGSKSTIKIHDGTIVILRSKQPRFLEAVNVMAQQLWQIMNYTLHVKVSKAINFYQMCEQLSKFLLG